MLIVCAVAFGGTVFAAKTTPSGKRPKVTAPSPDEKKLPPVPRLDAILPPSAEALDEQIAKGVTFLLQHQNKDGSWGDHGMTRSSNVLCPLPGGALAFRAAVTALDVMGLSSCAPEDPRVQVALDRAETWLLENLPRLRRPDDRTILDIWGYAYGIRALCSLSQRVSPESRAYGALKEECRNQIRRLMDIGDAGGGWGYYEFDANSTRPNGKPTSFCTATALLSLKDAENTFGLKGDAKIIRKAVKFLRSQRTPDGTYLYSASHFLAPAHLINRQTGSLARTPAANAALYLYGSRDITRQTVEDGLDWLWSRGGWLDMARKKPVPHESFAANAGYFFYYGYFYAALDIGLISPEKRPRHSAFLARILMPLQERDGSWWDFPLYNYHKAYGTGYALYSLSEARKWLYGEAGGALSR